MGQPVVEIVGQPVSQMRQVLQGDKAKGGVHLVYSAPQLLPPMVGNVFLTRKILEVGQGQLQHSPGEVKPQLEGAALVGPPIVIVGGGDVGNDGGQVRGTRYRCQPLGVGVVGPLLTLAQQLPSAAKTWS